MAAYYNEIDRYAAFWLRNLIARNLIAPGDVDERSIADVRTDDLRGYRQCHFFAGIAGWSYALRLAGWDDDRSVWTGSCPCQPFSHAGQGKAADDERHLWPKWFPLIAECHPATIFGEQVEAAIGRGWLDLVFADLEAEGYACASAVLPACSVGAPHIRQRLWFVADANGGDASAERLQRGGKHGQRAQDGCAGERLADANGGDASAERLQRGGKHGQRAQDDSSLLMADTTIARRRPLPERPAGTNGRPAPEPGRLRDAGKLGDAERAGLEKQLGNGRISPGQVGAVTRQAPKRTSGVGDANSEREAAPAGFSGRPSVERGRSPWAEAEWIDCRDGKRRPVEPGTFPLATGLSGRMGRLRAYGNAIVPQVAAEFIGAFMECQP